MASNAETGYAKNASNLDSLTSSLVAAGSTYSPARADMKVQSLELLSASAWAAIKAVVDNEKLENQAVASRQIALGDYKKFSTLIISALSGSGATIQKVAEATTIHRRIQGTRAGKKAKQPEEGAEVAQTHSISRASYDSITENFKSLVGTLKTEPLYMPNEPAITIAAIDTYILTLQNDSNAVNAATAATRVTRTERNKILFEPNTGLYTLVIAVKKYLRSVPALRDTYKVVVLLKFIKETKK